VERVITFRKSDWPVPGFDDAYYTDAKGSACVVIERVATRYDVSKVRFLTQVDLKLQADFVFEGISLPILVPYGDLGLQTWDCGRL
jgi:hypothetical protein